MFGVRYGGNRLFVRPEAYRRPLLGRFGPYIVAGVCGYELAALAVDGVPTVSDMVRRHPLLGVGVLVMLAHHWFVEQ
ncbi:MAG: hypothetical protein ACOYXR_09335 [Nitrospirota bacterium]